MEAIKVLLVVDDINNVLIYLEKSDGSRFLVESFEFPFGYEFGYKWGFKLAGFLGVDYTEFDLRGEK